MTNELDSFRLERMRPHQIRECRVRADLAFLPLGVLEWHGLQGPIGTDSLKTHHVCCLAARQLGGGAVAPPVTWGVPRDSFYTGFAPSVIEPVARAFGTEPDRCKGFAQHGGMDVQEQWLFYQRLLRMCFEQLASFGFRSIYICVGHGPLIHSVKPAAIAFARASQMADQTVTLDWGGEFESAGLSPDHGGKWETSLMMAADPGSVDLSELDRHPEYKGVGHGTDAVESTQKQGEAWVDACATAIANEARWLIQNYPRQPRRHSHAR